MSSKLDAVAKLEKNPKEIYEAARRLLVKIADNILKEPHNEKLRILQKGNATIKTKILGAYGGLDCLLSMGFQEDDAFLKLPLGAPLSKIERVRSGILQDVNAESDEPSRGAVPKSSTLKVSMHAARSRLNDVDKILIDYVKERPPLWNTSLPASQRTEEIQVALWQEIYDAIKKSNGDSRIHAISNTSALKKRWQLVSKIYETSDVLSSAEKSVWKCTIDRCKFLNAENTNEFASPPYKGLMQDGGVHKQFSAPIRELREVGHVDAEKSEFVAENTVNPVCVRLSEILDELPMVKRAKLEIEFLAMAYECLLNDEERSTQ